MPADPVPVANALYETWNEEGVAAVAEQYWHEHIEWRDDPSVPDAGAYYGRDRVRRHIEDRVDVLGNFHIDPERVLGAGENRVLVLYTVRGEGTHSAAPWELKMAQLLRFEDGRVIEVQDYLDPARALADLPEKHDRD